MATTTPILSLIKPATGDNPSELRTAISANADALDGAVLTGDARLLSAALQAALAGTAGTPGSANKFVTHDDIGAGVQAYDATLAALAGVTTAANKLIYATGVDTFATSDLTAAGRALIDDADAAAQRTTLGLGGAAVLATSALPGYEIGYDQITGAVSVASTNVAAPTTILTGSSYAFDGAPVVAEFFAPSLDAFDSSGVTQTVRFLLREPAASTNYGEILRATITSGTTATDAGFPVTGRKRFTPSAGSHAFSVVAYKDQAISSSVQAGDGTNVSPVPAYLRFTKV